MKFEVLFGKLWGVPIYFQKFMGLSVKFVDRGTFRWIVAKFESLFGKLWIANILI
jgi:hypothetical protein